MLQSHIALLRLRRYFEAVDDWNFAFWLNRNKIRLLVGEPVFPKKDQAIDYAQNRASFRSGAIRVMDSTGKVERTIPFSEAGRRL